MTCEAGAAQSQNDPPQLEDAATNVTNVVYGYAPEPLASCKLQSFFKAHRAGPPPISAEAKLALDALNEHVLSTLDVSDSTVRLSTDDEGEELVREALEALHKRDVLGRRAGADMTVGLTFRQRGHGGAAMRCLLCGGDAKGQHLAVRAVRAVNSQLKFHVGCALVVARSEE